MQAMGVPQEISLPILREIDKWAKSSGEEWTCRRIKVLKQDLLLSFAGLPPTNEEDTHVRIKRHSDGTPVGAFAALFRLPKRKRKIAWNAIMVYSSFVYSGRYKVTTKQLVKFEKALGRTAPNVSAMVRAKDLVDRGNVYELNVGDPMHLYGFVPTDRRAPLLVGTAPEARTVINSLFWLTQCGAWCEEHRDLVEPLVEGIDGFWEEAYLNSDMGADNLVSGMLGWLQEPGYKLRFIANPMRALQCLLTPLKNAAFNSLRPVKQDYTFRQDDCVPFAQAKLRQGATAYCFDLQNATDHFPLDLSLYQLRRCGVAEIWVTAYRDICRGAWLSDDLKEPKLRKGRYGRIRPSDKPGVDFQVEQKAYWWDVGQPLGLGPVFAVALGMTHGALIRGIAREAGVGDDCFMLLGDDVAIFDETVATRYLNVLADLEIPVSADKTLVSSSHCEFAGRIITESSVLKGYKWKGYNEDNFLDVARNLGPTSLPLFSTQQQSILRTLGPVPTPYGCGWNPQGRSYSERIGCWEFTGNPLSPDPRVVRPERNAQILHYSAGGSPWYKWLPSTVGKVDQTLQKSVSRLLSGLPLEIACANHLRTQDGTDPYSRTLFGTGDPWAAERAAQRSQIKVLQWRIRREAVLRKRRARLLEPVNANALPKEGLPTPR